MGGGRMMDVDGEAGLLWQFVLWDVAKREQRKGKRVEKT
jgi:hypothetical protein